MEMVSSQELTELYAQLPEEDLENHLKAVAEVVPSRLPAEAKTLGFWDYIRIAFYTKFAPKKLSVVGPVRATLWALPSGKTFVKTSPVLQELRPAPSSAPLPMPKGSIVPFDEPQDCFVPCTSASFELDDEFEAEIQKRNAQELADRENSSDRMPQLIESLNHLTGIINSEIQSPAMKTAAAFVAEQEILQRDIQKVAEDLVTAEAGVDLIHTEKKEQ